MVWILAALNAALLAALLVTLWRLHHLQQSRVIHNGPDRWPRTVAKGRPKRPFRRRSPLDEFPAE
jgi:hypothetical protein